MLMLTRLGLVVVGAVLQLLPVDGLAQAANVMVDELRPTSNIRTFFARLTPNSGGAPDVVHFNAKLSQLLVCSGGDPARCGARTLRARDVVPYYDRISNGHSLLVVRGRGDYRLCGFTSGQASSDMRCTGISGAELAGLAPMESATRSAILFLTGARTTDEYQCGLSPKFGLLCSSAQRLQERDGALLFGSFEGFGTQILSLSSLGNRLCQVGGSCRDAGGLDGLRNADFVATSARLLYEQDRAGIFGLADALQTACFLYMASTSSVSFHCEQASHNGGDDGRVAYTVHGNGREVRDLIAFREKRDISSGQAAKSLGSWRNQVLKELSEKANLGAGGRPQRPMPIALSAYEGDWITLKTASGDPVISPLVYEAYGGPNLFQVKDPTGNLTAQIWTDAWGYDSFVDMLRLIADLGPMPRAECLVECDREKAMRDDFCDLLAMDVALFGEGYTIGATISAAFSGPGALGVWVAGTATSAGIGAAVGMVCKGVAAAERMRCYQRCPLR